MAWKEIASFTYDFGNVLSGASTNHIFSVPGAKLSGGWVAWTGEGLIPVEAVSHVYVSSDDNVTVAFYNPSAGTITIGEITFMIVAFGEE